MGIMQLQKEEGFFNLKGLCHNTKTSNNFFKKIDMILNKENM